MPKIQQTSQTQAHEMMKFSWSKHEGIARRLIGHVPWKYFQAQNVKK